MTIRQELKQLGLTDYDLRQIREVRKEYELNREAVYEAQHLSPKSAIVSTPSYQGVYTRLTQRKLSGISAREYVKQYVKQTKSNIQTIINEGVTEYDISIYGPSCDLIAITVQYFLNRPKKDQVIMLQDLHYAIYGEYSPYSDPYLIALEINKALNGNTSEEVDNEF